MRIRAGTIQGLQPRGCRPMRRPPPANVTQKTGGSIGPKANKHSRSAVNHPIDFQFGIAKQLPRNPAQKSGKSLATGKNPGNPYAKYTPILFPSISSIRMSMSYTSRSTSPCMIWAGVPWCTSTPLRIARIVSE